MIRVEDGTVFYDSTDERCFFNKILLEKGGFDPMTSVPKPDVVVGFVQCYDMGTGQFKRYCGLYGARDPAASIKNIIRHGSKFDNFLGDWNRATERNADLS